LMRFRWPRLSYGARRAASRNRAAILHMEEHATV
jgi:hypothetical protein